MSWFKNAFGFSERSYNDTKIIFNSMVTHVNGIPHINNMSCGEFELVSEDTHQLDQLSKVGTVTLENIVGDVVTLHMSKHNNCATFQVASQFNCLEMINPTVNPENGITCYSSDKTQGPICAMCCPAGIAFRNYLVQMHGETGQTSDTQIDMSKPCKTFIETFFTNYPLWQIRNGYMMFQNEDNLKTVSRILMESPITRRAFRSFIQSGSHTDQSIKINGKLYKHKVNHVYCSGLPINYNNINHDMWDGLAELFLEAMYYNTLVCAVHNNIKSGINAPCYLTMIGGGVFGMKHYQIVRAIQRACNVVAKRGYSLNVFVVHYMSINEEYTILPHVYPINGINVLSVWDNITFIEKISK
jgi:hypothetical protein